MPILECMHRDFRHSEFEDDLELASVFISAALIVLVLWMTCRGAIFEIVMCAKAYQVLKVKIDSD